VGVNNLPKLLKAIKASHRKKYVCSDGTVMPDCGSVMSHKYGEVCIRWLEHLTKLGRRSTREDEMKEWMKYATPPD
jgi:hypothetical protein